MFFSTVQGSSNIFNLAYMLSSLGILSYDDFSRQGTSLYSRKLDEDLRFWVNTGKVKVSFDQRRENALIKEYTSKDKVFEHSQKFLNMFPFIPTLSSNKQQDFLYIFLNWSEYEIGDSIPLNSKAVGMFLIAEKKTRG